MTDDEMREKAFSLIQDRFYTLIERCQNQTYRDHIDLLIDAEMQRYYLDQLIRLNNGENPLLVLLS